jgi:hypothetical protein
LQQVVTTAGCHCQHCRLHLAATGFPVGWGRCVFVGY